MDEKLRWRDHHCMDAGVEYDQKHADLEKLFGVTIPVTGVKFWSRILPGPTKRKFKRKANGRDLFIAWCVMAKTRILERSASAARSYFLNPAHSSRDSNILNLERNLESTDGSHAEYKEDQLLRKGVDLSFMSNPLLYTLSKLRNPSNVSSLIAVGDAEKKNQGHSDSESLQGGIVAVRDLGAASESTSSGNKLGQSYNNPSEHQQGSLTEGSTSAKARSIEDLWSYLVVGPIQKLKSEVAPKVEDIVAELVDGADQQKNVGIEKMLPLTLDSVQFKGGTLMLLAYGDKEPREMENTCGHVRFQNHYTRVHVQLNGNCKMWRTDRRSEDGGWLSTDVFVDTVEQKWHCNLKVVNLFAPLFERILDIPISWFEGRASGEVHICMSKGGSFPNLHGQLDVTGLNLQIYDAASSLTVCFCSLSLGKGDAKLLQNIVVNVFNQIFEVEFVPL